MFLKIIRWLRVPGAVSLWRLRAGIHQVGRAAASHSQTRWRQAVPVSRLSHLVQRGGQLDLTLRHTQHRQPGLSRMRQEIFADRQPEGASHATRTGGVIDVHGMRGWVRYAGKCSSTFCGISPDLFLDHVQNMKKWEEMLKEYSCLGCGMRTHNLIAAFFPALSNRIFSWYISMENRTELIPDRPVMKTKKGRGRLGGKRYEARSSFSDFLAFLSLWNA